MQVGFKSQLKEIKQVFHGSVDLSGETDLLSATPKFASEHAGPILQKILESIPWHSDKVRFAEEAGLQPIVDFRVSRLMPGMYPAIPGWHCDAVPRKDFHSQPDFNLLPKDQIHYVMNLSSDPSGVSNTEFVLGGCGPFSGGPITINLDETKPVWQQVHRHIESLEYLENRFLEQGKLYEFSSYDIHRATPAIKRGWRAFFRLSYVNTKPMNILPRQQQIYVLSEENGW